MAPELSCAFGSAPAASSNAAASALPAALCSPDNHSAGSAAAACSGVRRRLSSACGVVGQGKSLLMAEGARILSTHPANPRIPHSTDRPCCTSAFGAAQPTTTAPHGPITLPAHPPPPAATPPPPWASRCWPQCAAACRRGWRWCRGGGGRILAPRLPPGQRQRPAGRAGCRGRFLGSWRGWPDPAAARSGWERRPESSEGQRWARLGTIGRSGIMLASRAGFY